MATAVNNQSNLDLGNLLKILSEGGVYNQLSTASEIWSHIMKRKAAKDGGRQKRYEIMTEYGPRAVQFTGFSSTAAFPSGQRSSVSEGIAQYKDIDLTVEYDLTLENRTGSDLLQYARPLAHEMDAKGIVASRIMSAACMGDGSGAIGRISSIEAADGTLEGTGEIRITLSSSSADAGRSHVGWFELGDIIKCHAADNTQRLLVDASAGNPDTAQVVEVNVENNYIVIAKDPDDTAALAEDGTWAANDYLYRTGTTANDISSIAIDYNALSEVFPGLEALAEDNGITVNNITMSGAAGGSRYDVSGGLISRKDFQALLSKIKRRVGANRYKYSKALMHHDTYDAMVELADADKTFFNTVDFKSGAKKVGYSHGKDFLEFVPDEFVQKTRIFCLPDDKGVLEYHGRDFERVNIGNQKEFLKQNGSGQYLKQSQAFMSAGGVLIAKHPAAIGVLENFVLS